MLSSWAIAFPSCIERLVIPNLLEILANGLAIFSKYTYIFKNSSGHLRLAIEQKESEIKKEFGASWRYTSKLRVHSSATFEQLLVSDFRGERLGDFFSNAPQNLTVFFLVLTNTHLIEVLSKNLSFWKTK